MNVEVSDLKFSYNSNPVLNNINMAATPMVTAVIGPNAAGKSTLLKCIAGLLKPDGNIKIDGKNIKTYRSEDLIKNMSYLPQDISGKAVLTVLEAVLLGRLHSLSWNVSQEDIDLVMKVLYDTGIEDLASRNMDELSGGQKQMVSIAQSLVRNPQILMMDEPTNSLDLQHQLEVFDLIRQITKERNMTTIVALHDLNIAARYADNIVIINNGEIHSSGPPDTVLTEEMIQEIYRVKARVTMDMDDIPQIIPLKSMRHSAK